jgi:hypothetical protein
MIEPGFLRRVAYVWCAGLLAAPAMGGGLNSAQKLSEALGGSLEAGLIVGGAGYGRLDSSVPLRRGRGEIYRVRVALGLAHNHLATSAHWMNAPSISLTRSA